MFGKITLKYFLSLNLNEILKEWFTSRHACSDPRVQVQVETVHLPTEIIL